MYTSFLSSLSPHILLKRSDTYIIVLFSQIYIIECNDQRRSRDPNKDLCIILQQSYSHDDTGYNIIERQQTVWVGKGNAKSHYKR